MTDFEQFRKRSPHDEREYLHLLKKLLAPGKLFGFIIPSTDDVIYDTSDAAYEEYTDSASDPDEIDDSSGSSISWASNTLGKYFSVFAKELMRLEERAYDLVSESVPGLSVELLENWYEQTLRDNTEAVLVGDNNDAKRSLAHGKIYNESVTATASFFEDYASTLGFTVTVNESPVASNPFICGVSKCGIAPYPNDPDKYEDVHRMGGRGAFSVIQITITGPGANGEGNVSLMQQLFDSAKPAHVVITWVDSRP